MLARRGAIILAIALLSGSLSAATYYVEKSGKDSNAGTQSAPWLTIGKAAATMVAGDEVIIGDGDFDEHIQETTSGASGQTITYKAKNPGKASLRAFRLRAAYVKLDGLTFSKFSGVGVLWDAAIRIEPTADNCTITNCVIRDLPSVIAHDFSFDHTRNAIISPSSDFISAGFKPGSRIYLGAAGATINGAPLYYANHDTTWQVATVDKTVMTVTGGAFAQDPGQGYWAFVRAGVNSGGTPAIYTIQSGGDVPEGVTITNNKIYNWPAHAINIVGNGFLLENNHLTDLKSFRFLSFSGSNHVIRRNVVRNAKGVLYFTGAEFATIIHPAGAGWYDYQVGMVSGFTVGGGNHQNILFEENWFENVENQLGRVDDEVDGAYDIRFNRNVFIGVSAHFSGGRDGMKWTNNTFFRCAWGDSSSPLLVGGRPPEQTGYEITGNLFIACGPQGLPRTLTRGYYGISDNAVLPVADRNMVASEEVTGYAAKTSLAEKDGVNGGDPVFYSTTEFLGPDQEPFTADDGLQVLPNSPAARLGGGALGVYKVVNGKPVAHFRLTAPQGWFEPTGDEYDLEWLGKLPTTRGRLERPFDSVPRIGEAPLPVSFDASKSLSGVNGGTTTAGIVKYEWNFGDGRPPVVTSGPTVNYVYNAVGDHMVALTVTNSLGNSHTYRNPYRVTGRAPAAPKNVRKIETD